MTEILIQVLLTNKRKRKTVLAERKRKENGNLVFYTMCLITTELGTQVQAAEL